MNPVPPRRRPLSDNLTVALGTALSRLTGYVRILALAWVLIPVASDGRLSDVYTLANTAPNIVYDLVLGGVLAATLVPRFTRAVLEEDREAIDAIVTVSFAALAALTVVATLAAPLIIRVYTVFSPAELADQYNAVATSLAYFFLPQVFFYGMTSVLAALLNARGRFFAAAWAPVLTNVVTIVGLLVVKATFDAVSIDEAARNGRLRLELGLGATLGVAAMALVLLPAVRNSGGAPRPRFDVRHPAIREVMRLSSWTAGYVISNQVAFFVITVLAVRVSSDYSAYTYMYMLLQLPHGLLAVTIMTTYTPRLTRAHVAENGPQFRTLVRAGTRVLVGLLLPAAAVFVGAPGAVARGLTFKFGTLDASADVLRAFGVGLVAFSVYLFLLRGFYAMQDTRTPFMVNLVQNACNIVLAVALGRSHGAAGLAWAFSLSYLVAVVLAWRRLDSAVRGGLRAYLLVPGVIRALLAAIPMTIAVWAAADAIGATSSLGSLLSLLPATVIGLVCYLLTLVALGGMAPRGTTRLRTTGVNRRGR